MDSKVRTMRMKMIDKAKFIVSVMGNKQLTITIPKVVAEEMGWAKGQKLALSKQGSKLILEEYMEAGA